MSAAARSSLVSSTSGDLASGIGGTGGVGKCSAGGLAAWRALAATVRFGGARRFAATSGVNWTRIGVPGTSFLPLSFGLSPSRISRNISSARNVSPRTIARWLRLGRRQSAGF